MFYFIDRDLEKMAFDISTSWENTVAVFTEKEICKYTFPDEIKSAKIFPSNNNRFCKVEVYEKYISGTFSIPNKKKKKQKHSFSFLIWNKGIVFIDDNNFINRCIGKMQGKKTYNSNKIGRVFVSFLEHFIYNDLLYIDKLEDYISNLEALVLDGKIEDFNKKIIDFRNKTTPFTYYYSQLEDVVTTLQTNEYKLFDEEEERLFDLFGARVGRLKNEVHILREYSVQVREIYQSQLSAKQNETMMIITIITAIFFPLSLITGWYGMNFVNMPELHWKYGYPVIIIISSVIVIFCIWIFKRKKYL